MKRYSVHCHFSSSLLFQPGVSRHTLSTFSAMDTPLFTTLTKHGMGVGEEKWCGAGEDFSSSQPGLRGKMISTRCDDQLNPLLQFGGHGVPGLKAQHLEQLRGCSHEKRDALHTPNRICKLALATVGGRVFQLFFYLN